MSKPSSLGRAFAATRRSYAEDVHYIRVGYAEQDALRQLAARCGLSQREMACLAIRYFVHNVPDWFTELELDQNKSHA